MQDIAPDMSSKEQPDKHARSICMPRPFKHHCVKSRGSTLMQGPSDSCVVTVKVVEKGVLGLRVGTYVQGAGGMLQERRACFAHVF